MEKDMLALLGVSCLVVGVLVALALELGSMLKHRRELMDELAQRRHALQENMRGLITELSETEHESGCWVLRDALAYTLVEYRSL